jgi:hypothetical protein
MSHSESAQHKVYKRMSSKAPFQPSTQKDDIVNLNGADKD